MRRNGEGRKPLPIKRLFLIDGSSYLFRAFHAIKGLSTSRGFPTNAIFGFTSMLLKILRDYKPEAMAVVFDAKGPTFRSQLYGEYKAQRPPAPGDLKVQIPYVKEILQAFRIPILEKEGFEADDVIGALTKRARQEGIEVVIVSGDKDLLQLVGEGVVQLDTMKDETFGPEEVQDKIGVRPELLPDFIGLCGDSIDNIPGVPGIGKKTAAELIRKFGPLEQLLSNLERIPDEELRPKLKEKLKKEMRKALLSKRLATIRGDVPLEFRWEDFLLSPPEEGRLRQIFEELEFRRFLKELFPPAGFSHEGYRLLGEEDLTALVERLRTRTSPFAFSLPMSSRDPLEAEPVGVALCPLPKEAYYLPLGHRYEGAPLQMGPREGLGRLRPLFEGDLPKYGHEVKRQLILLLRQGIDLKGLACDAAVAAYLLDPEGRDYSLQALSERYLGRSMSCRDVGGKGGGLQKVQVEQAKDLACEEAEAAYLLSELLLRRLDEEGLRPLFQEIEVPLIEVLAWMEIWGVKVDVGYLQRLSEELQGRLRELQEEVWSLAGEEFNLNSPQQVGKVLFEKLGLPVLKKTKKKAYSTDVEVLEALSHDHEVPRLLLEYRTLQKLKSAYVDALPKLINPSTGRIHTSYNQTATATGRLSSSEPNLQNIPVRGEIGAKIREAFIPEEGWRLLSADYSQIELRILAHLSGDEHLIESFNKDEDIHARTASEVFGIPPEAVTPDMRRAAKVINFGIVYGMSPYGLAKELGVDQRTAAQYIEEYFKRYQGVRAFIDRTLEGARSHGYVTTLFGRRRLLPAIKSNNRTLRQFAERTAINTPIQGTAADLIKKAMIGIYRRIRSEDLEAKLIIQVHDELVLEVREGALERVEEVVREEMEGVADLRVPLVVNLSHGMSWGEIH